MTDSLLTVAQAAARLSLSRWRVYQLVQAGVIPAVRIGLPGQSRPQIRIDPDALEELVASGGNARERVPA